MMNLGAGMKWIVAACLLVAGFLTGSAAFAQASASDFTAGSRYDIADRLVGRISPDPDGAGPLKYAAVRNTYDNAGRMIKVETGELSAWKSDSVAPSAWTGFTVLQVVDTVYDNAGRKVKDIVSSGGTVHAVTQYSYDISGRLECTAGRMNPAAFGSLPASACTLGTQGSFGRDRIEKNIYNVAGQLMQVKRAFGAPLVQDYATYEYTNNGKRKAVIDANGNRAEMSFDGHDRQSRWTFPSKTAVGQINAADYEEYAYDPNGNRTSLRKRDGQIIGYSYDALNRVIIKDIPGGTAADVHYGYNLQNLQLFARFGSTSGEGVTNSYDGFGRLLSSANNVGGTSRTLSYLHDANGNRIRVTHPDSSYFTYDYDGLDRATVIRESAAGTTLATLTYDISGQRSGLARGGAGSTTYGYDGASRLQSLGHDLALTASDVTSTFGYNPESQMVTRTMTNDAYAFTGNVTLSRSYVVNGLNQYTTAGPGTYVHDANGNLQNVTVTQAGNTTAITYTYDAENRLIGASSSGGNLCAAPTCGTTASLGYDPAGRLSMTNGGTAGVTRFLYDGDALVAEYGGSGTLLRRYVHGPGVDEPIIWYEGAAVNGTTRRYLHANHQGSVVAATDGSGALVGPVHTYDPYGIPGEDNHVRFQYTGQIMIPEIGFYHYKARIYSPTMGRFLQTDPIGYDDQIHLYAYVGNDPVNQSDPSGECGSSRIEDKDGGCKGVGADYARDQARAEAIASGAAIGATIGAVIGGGGGAAGGTAACAPGGPAALACGAAGGVAGASEGAAVGGVIGGLVGAAVHDIVTTGTALFKGDPAPKRNEGTDVTGPRTRVPVRQINRTTSQVRQSLTSRGFNRTNSGPAEIYKKGNATYVIRPSTSSPSGVKVNLIVNGRPIVQYITR